MAFAIAVAVICYQDLHTCHRLPWPPRLIFTGLFFVMVDLFSIVSEELAGVIAIGTTLAILVNKGFVGDCNNVLSAEVTGQPTDATTFLNNPTPGNPSTSTGGTGTVLA
jgi:hypothetical protein